MKEKVIKINYNKLIMSGVAFSAILIASFQLPFTANWLAPVSYIILFVVGVTHLYGAFSENKHPIKTIIHSVGYFLRKVIK